MSPTSVMTRNNQLCLWMEQMEYKMFNCLFTSASRHFFNFFLCIYVQGLWQPTQSVNSDLQCGLDRHLQHTQHWTQNRTSKQSISGQLNTTAKFVVKYKYWSYCKFKSRLIEPAGLEPAPFRCWLSNLSKYGQRP